MTGALDVLEGEAGFGAATAGDVDWSPCLAPFGPSYLIERTSVKPLAWTPADGKPTT